MRIIRLAGLALPLLAAASASAADLPRRNYAPPPSAAYAPVSAFSWTGFYVGVNAGYTWGSLASFGNATFDKPTGFTLGGTAGYNHQIDRFVIGVEGDLNWANVDTSRRIGSTVYSADVNWTGTLRARVGYAADRALLYVTGGYAGASLDLKYSDLGAPASGSHSGWRNGWALGVGLEYAFTRNVSAKAEYLYTSFSSVTAFPTPYISRAELSASTVRMGLNYRF